MLWISASPLISILSPPYWNLFAQQYDTQASANNMSYNYRDTIDSDLIYPNLVSANIKTSNPTTTTTTSNKNLPPQPPQSSSILQSAYNITSQPTLIPYKFEVEREVLERAKKREENKKKGLSSSDVDESIELTLSEVERTATKWDFVDVIIIIIIFI